MRSSVSVSTAGESIVQNQDLRIAQDGAGQRGALLLAAGKRDAALADHGFDSPLGTRRFPPRCWRFPRHLRWLSSAAASTPKAMFSRTVSLNR